MSQLQFIQANSSATISFMFKPLGSTKRILCNCADGTQRLAMEQHLKIGKIDTIVCTDISSAFGAIGLAMTCSLGRLDDDDERTMTIRPILKPRCNAGEALAHYTEFTNAKIVPMKSNTPFFAGDTVKVLPFFNAAGTKVLCTMFRCPNTKGKFDAEKASKMKLPGALRGKLAAGQTVTLNGETIAPSDLFGPDRAGFVLAMLSADTLGEFTELLDHKSHLVSLVSSCDLLIHNIDREFLKSLEYVEAFGTSTLTCQHVLRGPNPVARSPAFESLQSKLADLSPYYVTPLQRQSNDDHPISGFGEYITVAPGLTMSNSKVVDPGMAAPDLPRRPSIISNEKPYVLLLGTACAIPSPLRNTSGFLLSLPTASGVPRYILLDCGEGTLSQLASAFGDELDSVLSRLDAVYISHSHGDHTLGLPALLIERHKVCPDVQCRVVGPQEALDQTRSMLQRQLLFDGVKIAFAESDTKHCAPHPEQLRVLKTVDIVLVKHMDDSPNSITPAFGYVFELDLGSGKPFKFGYSGDTKFCTGLCKACAGADLVIHEATFPDGEEDRARENKHSTVSDVMKFAELSGVKAVCLTHFSPRSEIAGFKAEEVPGVEKFDGPVILGSDLLLIPFEEEAISQIAEASMEAARVCMGDDE
ncbi:Beta-lactamase superfamily domain [Carpediemonas membranifera]|uniref:ribonuclease Z n=1 Tax=Carpediemonas membranifera TaxID=201153 RepID=A0A8J6E2G8_9EUKA|nr:Beta-lactamase superfamily domain [Carpediemonas membranifera]|eukprot:KAG9397629.1 Beta-lactamase superfamily domain [Carpediemonas membranifera]